MSMSLHDESVAALIDEIPLPTNEIVDLVRRQGSIPRLIQEWVIDNALKDVVIDKEIEDELVDEYRKANDLTTQEAFIDHLQMRHISERLLRKMVIRPHQVVRYREERWGPFAQSLYLQHKEKFDLVSYYRLGSSNPDVMQEIYFRLKDGEESWDGLARQFPGATADTTALQGPTPVAEIEATIVEALRQSEKGRIIRPLQVGSEMVVVALEEFQPSSFGEEVRTALLRQAFDEWIAQECGRMLNKVRFPE